MEKKTEEEEELMTTLDSSLKTQGLGVGEDPQESPGPPNSGDTHKDPKRQNLTLPSLGRLRLTRRKSLPKVSQPEKQRRWAPNPGRLALSLDSPPERVPPSTLRSPSSLAECRQCLQTRMPLTL